MERRPLLRKIERRKGWALGKYAVDYEMRVDYNRLRRERLQRAKDQINKDGLGSLITWDEANIRYLTSYCLTTPLRANELQFVIIPRNGEPVLFGARHAQRNRAAYAVDERQNQGDPGHSEAYRQGTRMTQLSQVLWTPSEN